MTVTTTGTDEIRLSDVLALVREYAGEHCWCDDVEAALNELFDIEFEDFDLYADEDLHGSAMRLLPVAGTSELLTRAQIERAMRRIEEGDLDYSGHGLWRLFQEVRRRWGTEDALAVETYQVLISVTSDHLSESAGYIAGGTPTRNDILTAIAEGEFDRDSMTFSRTDD